MLSTNVLCIKKKKKRSYCISNRTENGTCSTEKTKRSSGGAETMLQITEDTPPDMLAGAMDLTVLLPTDRSVKMSVERSTPMMDLLVQITTNYHLQLSGYTLQVLGMAPSKEHNNTILPYKPNTPIGALDTQHIKVIPKTKNASVPKNVPLGRQPFESTFRLKVHLPRNQLYVTRVSQSVHLEDIMKKVCEEKNLDPLKYEFRHPGNLDEILNPKLTLSDYAITEIHVVQKGSTNLNQTFSADIMALRKEEERKQMHNKTGGGVFNLIFRRGKSSTGSLSSDNRSISPTHSDDSRSVTPPGIQQGIISPSIDPPEERPKPPQRKRRPAPKPPVEAAKKSEALTICHSRNSSDSSGYHEASVLSDNCNTSLPRRPKSVAINEETQKLFCDQHSQSTSNLSKMSVHSRSTSSLAFPSRKKKTAPPPPPPVLKPENTESNLEEPSPVVASQPCTVVAEAESVASTANTCQRTPFDSLNFAQQSEPSSSEEQKPKEVEASDILVGIDTKNSVEKENEQETDWQYQLPSPPKAFRDSSPVAFADITYESIADSVVTSPELFEKLKVMKDRSEKETASDITSMVSEEEKPILNKLSLENLEKRKTLVYNRELATSLKIQSDERKNDTFTSSLVNFEKTFDEIRKSSPKQNVSTSILPNFKITTYNPKQKLDIFEDDTVRSNTDRGSKRNSINESTFALEKSYIGRSMENISFRKTSLGRSFDEEFNKNSEYKFYKPSSSKPQLSVSRSESFTKEQTWVPSKPVTRSKSQIALNKYKETKNLPQTDNDNLTKSNSLFDVSGLQSLGVMRLIQNKLNTPNTSVEHIEKEEPSYQKQPESKSEVQNHIHEKPIVKTYKYRPPSINMGTWSERPKIPVNVKEDPDYRYSVKDTNTSKHLVNTVRENIKNYKNVEVRNKATPHKCTNAFSVRVGHEVNNKNVNIKINGFEPANQNSGNVVIKIGGSDAIPDKSMFRRPLGNINNECQRPHSIAFGSDFDTSRVPIVRSVEFKKPYKDYQTNTTNGNNTSITQIFSTDTFVSPKDTISNQSDPLKNKESTVKSKVEAKPIFRVNSYLQNSSAPVVRGFRSEMEVSRMSWNQPHSFSTLPAKPTMKNFSLNAPLPFSQPNMRRSESTNLENKNVPPSAPAMPKTFHTDASQSRDNCGDPKEQLLQAIRDFGGKKGLRAVKA